MCVWGGLFACLRVGEGDRGCFNVCVCRGEVGVVRMCVCRDYLFRKKIFSAKNARLNCLNKNAFQ